LMNRFLNRVWQNSNRKEIAHPVAPLELGERIK
jgi:hypothetical protein